MKRRTEDKLYIWGIIVFAAIILLAVLKQVFLPEQRLTQLVPVCVVYAILGFYCPGCGGTRALQALLTGHVIKAAVNFPMLVYCAAVYIWFMVSHTVEYISRGRLAIGMKYSHGWLYGALGILIIHWIGKNVFYFLTGTPPFLP